LAANGADLAVNYLSSEQRAGEIVEQFRSSGSKAVAIKGDVTVAEDVERLVRETGEALGGSIDILVNNAGAQVAHANIEDMTLDLWNKVIALNLTSAMLCAKGIVPGMKRKGWGRIINISSISGRTGGGPKIVPYTSAKAGLIAFTKGLAKELGPSGITVNSIAPGVIMTEIHERFSTKENLESLKKQTPLGRHGQPQDVSGAVLFLASDSASYITGETIAVNGGLRMD
jgi:3-oxoacyl-[acyl-carrier protein] reductase